MRRHANNYGKELSDEKNDTGGTVGHHKQNSWPILIN